MTMDEEQFLTQQDNYRRNVRARQNKRAKQVMGQILQGMDQEQQNSRNGNNIMEDYGWNEGI